MAAKRAEWRPGGGGVREIGWQVHGHPRAGGLGGSGWGFLGAAVHGRRQKSAWLSPTGGVRESKTEISVEDTRYAGTSAYWVTYGGWGIAFTRPRDGRSVHDDSGHCYLPRNCRLRRQTVPAAGGTVEVMENLRE